MPLPDVAWTTPAALAALSAFLLSAAAVVVSRLRFARRRSLAGRIASILADRATTAGEARLKARDHAMAAPLGMVTKLAAEAALPQEVEAVLAEATLQRRGLADVERDARAQNSNAWSRMAALRVLAAANPEAALEPLRDALTGGRRDLANAAVTLLGRQPSARAAGFLAEALQAGRLPRSRVATALEHFPTAVPEVVEPLIGSPNASVRYWAALLMRRYPGAPGLGQRLIDLSRDHDSLVRKAALDTLSVVPGEQSAAAAWRCLNDDAPYVRAQAARTLGALRAVDAIDAVFPLLADRNWWVRAAAKEGLESLGAAAEAPLVEMLAHPDPFARNSAAEILQNLGTFERLLTEEAEGPSDPSRIAALRRLARAGGVRMWDSALARLEAAQLERARRLLTDIAADFRHGTAAALPENS